MTNQQRFEAFHQRNPQVYRLLCEHARRVKASGFEKYGIKTIYAVLRWHADTGTQGQERYKLNDIYVPWYARLIMANEPDLAGFFNTREMRAL